MGGRNWYDSVENCITEQTREMKINTKAPYHIERNKKVGRREGGSKFLYQHGLLFSSGNFCQLWITSGNNFFMIFLFSFLLCLPFSSLSTLFNSFNVFHFPFLCLGCCSCLLLFFLEPPNSLIFS